MVLAFGKYSERIFGNSDVTLREAVLKIVFFNGSISFHQKWLSRQSKKSKEIPITLYYCRDLSFLKLSSLSFGEWWFLTRLEQVLPIMLSLRMWTEFRVCLGHSVSWLHICSGTQATWYPIPGPGVIPGSIKGCGEWGPELWMSAREPWGFLSLDLTLQSETQRLASLALPQSLLEIQSPGLHSSWVRMRI